MSHVEGFIIFIIIKSRLRIDYKTNIEFRCLESFNFLILLSAVLSSSL
jgi:hypothetical protein